jgi:hypothetical protein
MNGGKGVNFSAENYQLITPELRKSKNDWLNSIYVQYKPESDKGELYFPTTILTVSQFLTKLSEQTGRRFAFQKGLEQQVSIGAEDEKWIAVLERFIEASKLELENVGDILVVSAPPPVIIEEKTDLKGIGFTMVLIAMVLGITVWFVFRPKKRVDPRGGWR